ncbi:hypothetical protein PF010_g17998 [Phytophthora fragariae]|uniref:Uncharacterized protein n=1 Tax=Phytophthora fragariae TaxID=53985 RepID=A0A6G0KLF3_9STRA|nr:hypothetical protein PF010_g17998 [Phytophthora fragariae]KAE9205582.1 hypothetical protein PF004_g17537 [Phytophthora fragariae]
MTKTSNDVAPIAFSEVVTLACTQLSLLLDPNDASSLLQSCSRSLKQDIRDIIATEALLYFYEFDGVHFGEKCLGDFHQLVPQGLERERHKDSRTTCPTSIDTDDVATLTRLMDVVEPGFGSQFFSSSDAVPRPRHVLEAHWRGIVVDQSSGLASCQFCEHYGDSPLFSRNPGESAADMDKMMRLHCTAVYQPMKRFMLQHLKHVRYVRPPRGWNTKTADGGRLMGLIAGITSSGVLCGVYVTSVCIPQQWIKNHLAPGHFTTVTRVAA